MNLERYQRGVLELVKGRDISLEDPHLQEVASSRGLAVMKTIAIWWRVFALESHCYFTSRALRRLGCFETMVTRYFREHPTSAFVEELSDGFLAWLAGEIEGTARCVIEFERAFLRARAGFGELVEVWWDQNPDSVFDALARGVALPPAEAGVSYRLRIGSDLPGLAECRRLRSPAD